MVYDFHTHSYLSDGALAPTELMRRCIVNGYTAMAIADHVAAGTMQRTIEEVRGDALLAAQRWDFTCLVAVEITHVPASAVAELAARARSLGAELVVVHGETIAEPVEPGTNLAAVSCPQVDMLAHPGLLTEEEASLAEENDIFLEITRRHGHCLTNGLVVRRGLGAGARLVVSSDGHAPGDYLTEELARQVALGAGVSESEIRRVLEDNPQELLRRGLARREVQA